VLFGSNQRNRPVICSSLRGTGTMSTVTTPDCRPSGSGTGLGMTNETAGAWADHFWARAGRSEPFPRDLESPVSWAMPLAIIKLPRLTLERTRVWLTSHGIRKPAGTKDRALRACLVARTGRGVVLLEGSDPADERRMSLAHEVAHFLVDYLRPREKALELMGEGAQAVLDGVRSPTAAERLSAILGGVDLGTYMHLIERSTTGIVDRVAVVEAEDRADRLALELLAPRQIVLGRLAGKLPGRHVALAAAELAESMLIYDFGLPPVAARRYAQVVVGGSLASRPFRDWLGA
jgi:hypothetical protein